MNTAYDHTSFSRAHAEPAGDHIFPVGDHTFPPADHTQRPSDHKLQRRAHRQSSPLEKAPGTLAGRLMTYE
ncbi:hypothetical protein [Sporosarcina cascadiensis]|uniref:hypothetical protein n=1 Tax=Sporosarcina cascadiensis TaxID=2660747 RepID=UPI00129A1E25|nr:hypothetical protein [Sporosarcina cascadiensis]